MTELTIFAKIGRLLNNADRLHLFYYEDHKTAPKDIPLHFAGGDCLLAVCKNPAKGLSWLHKKVAPFLKYCEAKIKKKQVNWGRAYAVKRDYMDLYHEVVREMDEMCIQGGEVDCEAKNVILVNYY